MCIVVRGESDDNTWIGRRSIETLAFHHASKRASILFVVLLENRKAGNYLHILHPGNSTCQIIPPWVGDEIGSLAYHPDEKLDHGDSVMHQVYRKMFKYRKRDGLNQVCALNPYESWYGLRKPSKVVEWPDEDKGKWTDLQLKSHGIEQITEVRAREEFVAFTAWRLGPFVSTGLVLACFVITFEGISFDHLVGHRDFFSVDGPGRLRSKIKYDFLPRMSEADQALWLPQMSFFDSYLPFRSSYDVIIRQEEEPDGVFVEVDEAGSYMITEAPRDRQPDMNASAKRYVTMDADFKLNLHLTSRSVETEVSATKLACLA